MILPFEGVLVGGGLTGVVGADVAGGEEEVLSKLLKVKYCPSEYRSNQKSTSVSWSKLRIIQLSQS